jgi:mono/diheme cytochrome c family protein
MSSRSLLLAGTVILAAAALVSAQDAAKRPTVTRNPAFTAEQAERGRLVYEASCINCHLAGLDGSDNPVRAGRGAPLVGPRFVQDFGEQRVSALYNKIKRDMPNGRGGTLSDREYLDVASYVLHRNNFPAGSEELTTDVASTVWIPGAGGAEGLADYTYVTTVGCLTQDPTRSWLLTGAQEMKKTDVPATGAAPVTVATDGPGEFTFRLLDAYHHAPEPHVGHTVRVTGYLVRLGAEIRVNVQTLAMVGASCAPRAAG